MVSIYIFIEEGKVFWVTGRVWLTRNGPPSQFNELCVEGAL